MKIMGLDVGSKTVGVAVSDPFGWTAQGLETIIIDERKDELGLERLEELIKEHQVEKVVIGLPKNMNNTLGDRALAAMNDGQKVVDKFALPVDYQDERLTTVQAKRMLVEKADLSRRKQKKVIDKLAAVLILQNYLDRKGG
jgi:putative Holliday junction resolvase